MNEYRVNLFKITYVSVDDIGTATEHESSSLYPLDNTQEVPFQITTPEGAMYTVTCKATRI